jgi:arylsulfatase A-like enzyme
MTFASAAAAQSAEKNDGAAFSTARGASSAKGALFPQVPRLAPCALAPGPAAPAATLEKKTWKSRFDLARRRYNRSRLTCRHPLSRKRLSPTAKKIMVTKLAIAGIAVHLALAAPALHAGEARKPNIIFILADDLGYGDLGCYGQKSIRTPRLDRFAKEGMRFTQFYAGSTVCAPSRCALMVGKHTGHCTIRGNALVPLTPEDVTVATLLRRAGYATGLVGKWGLGEPGTSGIPKLHGFDYFFGYLNQHHAHNYWPDYLWRNQDKVPLPANVQSKPNIAAKKEVYSHNLFTEEALKFIDQHKAEPFFLYLAYTLPHANNERGKEEGNGMEVPSDEPYSKTSWPGPQKNHAAMITLLDRDVGRVLDHLAALGIDEHTIVIFSSDNGPHREGGADPAFFNSSGGLRGFKRSLHEGGIRVPMLARWPGKIKAGTTNEHVGAFWDFLPTACELANVKAPAEIDGLSFLPTLLGKGTQARHDFLYWEFHEGGTAQGVRHGDWKAVRTKLGGALELYDLKSDVRETNNVAARHADVVARIEAYLRTARTESPHWPLKKGKK